MWRLYEGGDWPVRGVSMQYSRNRRVSTVVPMPLYGHAGREKEGTHCAGCILSVSRNQGWKCEKRGRAAPTPATPPTTSPSFTLRIALSTADYYQLEKLDVESFKIA